MYFTIKDVNKEGLQSLWSNSLSFYLVIKHSPVGTRNYLLQEKNTVASYGNHTYTQDKDHSWMKKYIQRVFEFKSGCSLQSLRFLLYIIAFD